MKRSQLVILLLLVLVLGGAGLLLVRHQRESWSSTPAGAGKRLLGDNFPVNDVAAVAIRRGTNELVLVKKDDVWRVRERGDYAANFQQLKEFLIKAQELKAAQTDGIGPSQLARFQLAAGQGSNSPVFVEFKDPGGKTLSSLALGKRHLHKSNQPSPAGEGGEEGWPDGRYVQAGGDTGNVALVSEPFDNVEPQPEQWLNKDFFRVEKARSVEVIFAASTNSWKLTRETETGEWKLADARPGEQLDSAKIASVSNPLSAPSFDDVMPGGKLEATGADRPTVVQIQTFDEFAYTVNVGRKTNEDYFLTVAVAAQWPKERSPGKDEKPEDKVKLDKEFTDRLQKFEGKLKREQGFANWTYLVAGWTVEPLLKERSQLLAEKKEEPKAEAGSPGKAELPALVKPLTPAAGTNAGAR